MGKIINIKKFKEILLDLKKKKLLLQMVASISFTMDI